MRAIQLAQNRGVEQILKFLDWFAAKHGKQEKIASHLATGISGEEAAFFYLRRLGFVIVAERWNDGPLPGDIDLIAWNHDVLCFLEVKTRGNRQVATASSAVDRHKRETLRRLARQYLRQLPGADDVESRPETRFDIVTVYELPGEPPEIEVIPGAFGWSERGDRTGVAVKYG